MKRNENISTSQLARRGGVNLETIRFCESCQITVHVMNERGVATKARKYGVQALPAIVINGKLAACCANRAVDAQALRNAGVGVRLA